MYGDAGVKSVPVFVKKMEGKTKEKTEEKYYNDIGKRMIRIVGRWVCNRKIRYLICSKKKDYKG